MVLGKKEPNFREGQKMPQGRSCWSPMADHELHVLRLIFFVIHT